MPDRNFYEAWKRRRAEAPVPDDFADHIMATLRLREQEQVRILPRMFRSPVFRVGVCSLACAVGLLRLLQIVVVFFAEQASR